MAGTSWVRWGGIGPDGGGDLDDGGDSPPSNKTLVALKIARTMYIESM